jgi:hypothetical protein
MLDVARNTGRKMKRLGVVLGRREETPDARNMVVTHS